MEKMLKYIKQISKVNTEAVEPLTMLHINDTNVCNADDIQDSQFKDKLLKNAPDGDEDYIIVPKTV